MQSLLVRSNSSTEMLSANGSPAGRAQEVSSPRVFELRLPAIIGATFEGKFRWRRAKSVNLSTRKITIQLRTEALPSHGESLVGSAVQLLVQWPAVREDGGHVELHFVGKVTDVMRNRLTIDVGRYRFVEAGRPARRNSQSPVPGAAADNDIPGNIPEG
jgi:hypothetical protein